MKEIEEQQAEERLDFLKENGYRDENDYERQRSFRQASRDYERMLSRGGW